MSETLVKQYDDFAVIAIHRNVYCSGGGEYFFDVKFTNNKKTRRGLFSLGKLEYRTRFKTFYGYDIRDWAIDLDNRARAEIYALIAASFDSFKVYGYDWEGRVIFEDLCGHDPDRFRTLYGPKQESQVSAIPADTMPARIKELEAIVSKLADELKSELLYTASLENWQYWSETKRAAREADLAKRIAELDALIALSPNGDDEKTEGGG